eukprot:gene32555-42171_t
MTSAIINAFSDSSANEVENFEISSPYNFKVLHHVQADPHSSTGFSGLPLPMRQVLKASGITKEETDRNPQAVLDVLTFHMEGPAPPPKRQMPTKSSLQKQMSREKLLKTENYKKNFSSMKKLANELAELTNEIGLQSLSKHPNIVEFIEAYAYEDDVCIVMELMT